MNKFTLKNINANDILLGYYGISSDDVEEIQETILDEPKKRSSKSLKKYIEFVSQHEVLLKFWIRMFGMSGSLIPQYYSKPCWNCRATFNSHPIGCPIEYYSIETLNETDKELILEKFKELNLSRIKDFFITEGIFCTFSCVKAYILESLSRSKSSKYKSSLTLLTLLRFKITGEISIIPLPSGSWKDTIEYGGFMSPAKLREDSGTLTYEEISANVEGPFMFPRSCYIRQKEAQSA